MIQGFSAPCLAGSIHFIIAVDICVRSLCLMVMLWREIDDMYYVCDVEFLWVVVLGGGVSYVVE